jgi:membrane protease YdiL (CAAX protease family)
MREYESPPMPPFAIACLLLAFVGAGMFIGFIPGVLVWKLMTGRGFLSMQSDMLLPQYANASRVVQIILAFFMFFVPAVAAARLADRHPFKFMGYKRGFNISQLLLVLVIIVACLPVVGALAELTKLIPLPKSTTAYFTRMEDNYDNMAEALSTMRSFPEFIFSLIVMALLPAVFEETLFRGVLQRLLGKWFKNPVAAIIVTGIIFSLVHISYYGFFGRLALGMVLGFIFYYSGSIYLSMAAHFTNNALAVGYMYYLSTHGKPVKEAMEESSSILWGIPVAILVVAMLHIFRTISVKRNINQIPPMDGPSIESNIA